MSEDTILIIKWLNSEDSDDWRAETFMQLYRPLLSAVQDGQPSSLVPFKVPVVESLWRIS
jgi:hypothetical protein